MTLHIASLGSSFAAGPGIRPHSSLAAQRSTMNYGCLLARSLNARHTDLTVSGSTLRNVLSEPQVLFGKRFEPQISLLPPDSDVVTITAGGNDLNYIGGIVSEELSTTTITRNLSRLFPVLIGKIVSGEDELVGRFVAVIDAIHVKAPGALVILIEYLTLFSQDSKAGVDVWMNAERMQHFQDMACLLQRAYVRAAEQRPGVVVLPVAKASQTHGLGSAEPWVRGWSLRMILRRQVPFHPNEQGMQAVAEMAKKKLQDIEALRGRM